jgi:hypothetical protein
MSISPIQIPGGYHPSAINDLDHSIKQNEVSLEHPEDMIDENQWVAQSFEEDTTEGQNATKTPHLWQKPWSIISSIHNNSHLQEDHTHQETTTLDWDSAGQNTYNKAEKNSPLVQSHDKHNALSTHGLISENLETEEAAYLHEQTAISKPLNTQDDLLTYQKDPIKSLLTQAVHKEALIAFMSASSDLKTWFKTDWPQMVYHTNLSLTPKDLSDQLIIIAKELLTFQSPSNGNIPFRMMFSREHIIIKSLLTYCDPEILTNQKIEWSKGIDQEQMHWLAWHIQQKYVNLAEPLVDHSSIFPSHGKIKRKTSGTGASEGVFYLPKARSHSMAWAVFFSTSIACVIAASLLLWLK